MITIDKYKRTNSQIPNIWRTFSQEVIHIYKNNVNVKELREKNNLTQQELSDKTGIPRARIAKWEQGLGKPKADDSQILSDFFEKFITNDFSREKNGRDIVPNIDRVGSLEPHEPPPPKDYQRQRRELKNSTAPMLVPLVPIKAQAGYARSFASTDYLNKLDLYPILPDIDPRGAIWRYFEIQGDSMESTLFERDYILVSQVPHEDWQDIRNGQVYVIVTGDEVLVKKVHLKDKDHWLLKSSNKRYKDRLIPVQDIKEVWYYRRRVTSKI